MNKNILNKTILIIFLLLSSCSHKKEQDFLVLSTPKSIKKNGDIKITLSTSKLDITQVSKNLKKLLSFTPKIKGDAKLSRDTIIFTPKKPLESGKKYKAKIKLSSFSKYKDFNFSFFVIDQIIELKNLNYYFDSNNRVIYQGNLILTDKENKSDIKLLFHAFLNNKEIKVDFLEDEDELKIPFVIKNIKDNSTLRISYPSSLKTKEIKEIKILTSDFKVIDFMKKDDYLFLSFSRELDENQDLKGFINIDNISLNYIIDKNNIKLFHTETLPVSFTLNIEKGIKDINGDSLSERKSFFVDYNYIRPQIKFLGKNNIIPHYENGNIEIPIKTMNLKSFMIKIKRIPHNNMLQYLQSSRLNNNNYYEIYKVAEDVYKDNVKIENFTLDKVNKWIYTSLNLSNLVSKFNKGVYVIQLGFFINDIEYKSKNIAVDIDEFKRFDKWEIFEDHYYYNNNLKDRQNPLKLDYYKFFYNHNIVSSKNFLLTNMAFTLLEETDNTYTVFLSNILSSEPVKNKEVYYYNYQQQLISNKKTDSNGFVKFKYNKNGAFFVAEDIKDNIVDRAYLNIRQKSSLPKSDFKIDGITAKNGLKGYLTTERSIYRPGDNIYVSFILNKNKLPDGYPIVLKLRNQTKTTEKIIKKNKTNHYLAIFKTNKNDHTGIASLEAIVGNNVFTKNIRIENIKPNRLKINLDFKETDNDISLKMSSLWLQGFKTANYKARLDVNFIPDKTKFASYSNYIFDDNMKKIRYNPHETIFEGNLNENGEAQIDKNLQLNASGKGKLLFNAQVYEPNGDFSITNIVKDYSPYDKYVGISFENKDMNQRIELDMFKKQKLNILLLDDNGVPQSGEVKISLYKLNWRWWWEKEDSLANYRTVESLSLIKEEKKKIESDKGYYTLKFDDPYYGRYLITVTDISSGKSLHSASKIFYLDSFVINNENRKSDNHLIFSSDKKEYNISDTVNIKAPSSDSGTALLIIEKNGKIIKKEVLTPKNNKIEYSFKAEKSMIPNVYVHINYIQKYKKDNDLSLRSYGTIPITIKDSTTMLLPVIETESKIKSDSEIEITVSEKNDKEMYYTLALVDEGLLGLDNYKLKNPHDYFYSKEASLLTTYDSYNYIVGAFSGKLKTLLSIGGGGYDLKEIRAKKESRFPPLVIFKGLFNLKKGEKKTHKIKIPNYMGEVRIMLNANKDNSFGSSHKSFKVVSPIALIETLPRSLRVSETAEIPITIFSSKKNKKLNVKISSSNDNLIFEKNEKEISLDGSGEYSLSFLMKAKHYGNSTITITATDSEDNFKKDIAFKVNYPSSYSTTFKDYFLKPNEEITEKINISDYVDLNKITIEANHSYPLSLKSKLEIF